MSDKSRSDITSEEPQAEQFGPIHVPFVLCPLFEQLAEQLNECGKSPEDLTKLTEDHRKMLYQFMDSPENNL